MEQGKRPLPLRCTQCGELLTEDEIEQYMGLGRRLGKTEEELRAKQGPAICNCCFFEVLTRLLSTCVACEKEIGSVEVCPHCGENQREEG